VSTNLILQSATRLSTTSTAGKRPLDRRQRPRRGHPRTGQVLGHHERQLGLDPGLHQPPQVDQVAVLDDHLVGQHPEVRLVHPEHPLHRQRRQPHLPPDHPLPRRGAPLDVQRLHRIGVLDHQIRIPLGQRRHRLRRAVGLPQLIGQVLMKRSSLHRPTVSAPHESDNGCGRRSRVARTMDRPCRAASDVPLEPGGVSGKPPSWAGPQRLSRGTTPGPAVR
jgi:hypothetical protein